MKALDENRLPKTPHHLSVLTGLPDVLPLKFKVDGYPRYLLCLKSDISDKSIFDLVVVRGPNTGQIHDICRITVPHTVDDHGLPDGFVGAQFAPEHLMGLWRKVDEAVYRDLVDNFRA